MSTIYDIETVLWPIAILQDRYRGTYTGGDWIAIPQADLAEDFEATVWGDDLECMDWAERYIRENKRVGVGNTPDEALADLMTTAENFRVRHIHDDPMEQIALLRDAIALHKKRVLEDASQTEAAEEELWSVLER